MANSDRFMSATFGDKHCKHSGGGVHKGTNDKLMGINYNLTHQSHVKLNVKLLKKTRFSKTFRLVGTQGEKILFIMGGEGSKLINNTREVEMKTFENEQ